MIRLSLTNFLDFAAASGAGRLTQVRKAKQQAAKPYEPATDYWRPIREGIREEFEGGWRGKQSLTRLRQVSADPKKLERYAECLNGLSKWARNKEFGPSVKVTEEWRSVDLTVVVNPEILLDIDGQSCAVKLYFRAEKLSKPKVDTLLYLLDDTLPSEVATGILDVPRGRLIQQTVDKPELEIVLAGDAAQFVTMWNRL
jgi:hypothetical protein